MTRSQITARVSMRYPYLLLAVTALSLIMIYTIIASVTQSIPSYPSLHFHVITSSTTSHLELCRITLPSAIMHKIPIHVLGLYYNETQLAQQFGTHTLNRKSTKFLYALPYLTSIPDDDVVLFVDAFDVLFQLTTYDIQQRYEALGRPDLLVMTENNCWPPQLRAEGYCDKYPPHPIAHRTVKPNRFLNSGAYIGRAWYIRQLQFAYIDHKHELMNHTFSDDDQGFFALAMLDFNSTYHLSLDYMNTIFMSLHNAYQDVTLVEQRDGTKIYFDNQGLTAPAMFHFNGEGKDHMQDMFRTQWFVNSVTSRIIDENTWETITETLVGVDHLGTNVPYKELCAPFISILQPNA